MARSPRRGFSGLGSGQADATAIQQKTVSSARRMKTSIKREAFLRSQRISPCCPVGNKDQIPTIVGNRARNDDEFVASKQRVAESLLAGARNSRPDPIGIWDQLRVNDVDRGRLENGRGRQHVRHYVQRTEPFVDRHLKDGRRGIDRAIHCTDPSAVPAPAYTKGTFATGPGRSKLGKVQAPCHQLRAAKQWWQGSQV
jgi:hypothetical protein